jgi:hypoxanthine-DNA glycosylase
VSGGGRRLVGFAPVASARTHTMVLGSFPGERALALGQYYGHPRNQFWPLLGAVLEEEELVALPYERRLRRVLARGFGLWDVVNACERAGSLDAAIRNAEPNDLARLGTIAPRLRRIGLNGAAARRFAPALRAAGYEVIELPSSSPAYAAMPFARKLARWRLLAG